MDFEFDLKSDLEGGIEIQGRQLVLDPQGELKQLYYHKALRGAAVWGFWFGEQQNDWHFGERRPLELQKESRMRASNSSSTLLGENENGWNIQRNDSILKDSDNSESLFSL